MHTSLEFLLEHLPDSLHLVLATRADPPLPLARLRARGQLTEVRTADLRFTVEEAAALLRQATGARSARRVGGGAGVADRRVGRRAAAGRAVAAGTTRCRWFRGGVQRQSPLRPGLPGRRRCSSASRSTYGRSCWRRRCSTGCPGSCATRSPAAPAARRLLEAIERANLFLMPLDEVRGWWRYHHLFADLLHARLRQEQPGKLPRLHRAAAAWCEAHGLGRRGNPPRAGRRGRRLGRRADRAALRRAAGARRGRDGRPVGGGAARRTGPRPAPAAPGPGGLGADGRPGRRSRAAARRRRTCAGGWWR